MNLRIDPNAEYLARAITEVQAELLRRTAEAAERNFRTFLEFFAWPVLEPAIPFAANWHVDAICDHLQAVHEGHIKRLIVSMPFRMLKSTIVSKAFPAWEWINSPWEQFLTASYAMKLSTRDAVDSRRIVDSPEYKTFWGDRFKMTGDQNVKTFYENDKRGTRIAAATEASPTGFGGSRIIIDDPISAEDANYEIERNRCIEWYKGTISTRLNDPKKDAIIVVHQRLHENDLTGYLLENEGDRWEHLVLPMRYEKKRSKTTSIGFKDPRTREGELLHPERLPSKIVSDMETTLGSYGTAAQLQQWPNKRSGNVLLSSWFPRWTVLPPIVKRQVFVDTAQKTGERNDYSVLQEWGLGTDGKIYLLAQLRARWEAYDLEENTIDFWNDRKLANPCVLTKLNVEDKASGTGLIQGIKRKGKIPVRAIQRTRDKLTRAYDSQSFMEAGLVCLPEGAKYLPELTKEIDDFTKDDTHAFDDQLDPMFDAIEEFLSKGTQAKPPPPKRRLTEAASLLRGDS